MQHFQIRANVPIHIRERPILF